MKGTVYMIKIAILGMGVVGGGVADVIMKNKAALAAAAHDDIEIKYILDLRDFPGHPLADRVTRNFNTIVNDPSVSIVVETMGGSHPAYEYTIASLRAGKHVVTSNKEVVANYGDEFLREAEAHGVHYLFEASVGGGIPLIRPLTTSLSTETISSIDGIVNGTTNYILTKMAVGGGSFEEALAEAKRLGYAEADPSADIDGIDAQRKICILTALITGHLLPTSAITTQSIRSITPADIVAAAKLGGAIKLIAHTDTKNGAINVFATPCFVPYSSPLAHIKDVYNGILVSASVSGDLMFYGQGAGRYPTAGSIVADIVAIIRGTQNRIKQFEKASASEVLDPNLAIFSHFVTAPQSMAKSVRQAFGIPTAKVETDGVAAFIFPATPHGEAMRAASVLSKEAPISLYRII